MKQLSEQGGTTVPVAKQRVSVAESIGVHGTVSKRRGERGRIPISGRKARRDSRTPRSGVGAKGGERKGGMDSRLGGKERAVPRCPKGYVLV